MISGQAARMIGIGMAIGITGSVMLNRWTTGMLFGVSPISLPVYLAVCTLLAIVAVVAVAIPSRRATRVDPLTALRDG